MVNNNTQAIISRKIKISIAIVYAINMVLFIIYTITKSKIAQLSSIIGCVFGCYMCYEWSKSIDKENKLIMESLKYGKK